MDFIRIEGKRKMNLKEGDFVFSDDYGVLRLYSIIDDTIEGTSLEREGKITLKVKEVKFLKEFDPSLAVPKILWSTDKLREDLLRLAGLKVKKIIKSKKGKKVEREAEEIIARMRSGELKL